MRIMKSKTAIFLLLAVLAACSTNIIKENNKSVAEPKNNNENKKLAFEKFIQGNIFETKGLFKEATDQYIEAAGLDPQPGIFYSLAKNFYRLNKLSNALKYAKDAVELEPQNIEYLEILASIYSASLLNDSSKSIYERIVEIDSTNASAYFQLAQLNEAKRPNQSLELYKKVIDLIGPEWSVLVRLVDLNERMGNVNETIKTVEELIKLNPSDLQLQKVLIDSYIKTKNFDAALKLTDESLISYPDDLSLREMKGNIFLQQSKWKEAYDEYSKLISDESILFDDKLKIGSLFFYASEKDSTNLELAGNIFKEINKDSLDWQVNAYLGEIELRRKNDSTAIQYFKNAASMAEWNPQLWGRVGGILFDNRKYDEAIRFMNEAAEKFPNDFLINLVYGLSLAQENLHADAKIYLQRALNLNPDDLTVLSALGFSLNQLKETDEALKYLNKALAADPDNVQIIGQTALIYESQKDFHISDSLYQHALSLDSTNVLILNNYAYSLSERNIKLDEALKMSLVAVEAEPDNSSYLDTIGWIYFMLGDFDKAKYYIKESLKHDENNATVIDHLGDVYYKLGEKDEAIRQWKKAAELDPGNEKINSKIEKGAI